MASAQITDPAREGVPGMEMLGGKVGEMERGVNGDTIRELWLFWGTFGDPIRRHRAFHISNTHKLSIPNNSLETKIIFF